IVYDGKVFVSTGEGPGSSQVYRSLDGGLNFSAFGTGLSLSDAFNQNQFHASGDRLYLGALLDAYYVTGSTVALDRFERSELNLFPTIFESGINISGLVRGDMVTLIDLR